MSKRSLSQRSLALLVLLMVASLCAFSQIDTIAVNSPGNETPQAWLVELNSAPIADGGNAANLRLDKDNFRKAARTAGLQFAERGAFDKLWNGLSIAIAPADAAMLKRIPGVKNIYPVVPMGYEPGTPVNLPDISNAIQMTKADYVQNTLGFTGKGVKVGVIDTGIDYKHPDLGGCFGPGCRVVAGYDFVGDAYTGYNTAVPGTDPMDCAGHGTHVSGIIGANGALKGVAPDVTFYAYRVFGCAGSTQSDIMIAAMERAFDDKVDVVNMSIGAAFQEWPEYPTAQAADRLVNRGTVVVASIGNSGQNGLYSAGAPGVGKKVIGVASVDNSKVPMYIFSVGTIRYGYNTSTDSPLPPTTGGADMAATGTPTSTADACNPLSVDLTGKIALIRRGSCSFYIKTMTAQAAGAVAVVLYNNAAGYVAASVTPPAGSPKVSIPVVGISDLAGIALNNLIAAGPTHLNWLEGMDWFVNYATGGQISYYSSFGLDYELNLKPDISAPGGMIYSTFPRALGSYAVMSGTSMASPHVAGAAALLLQAKPKTQAALVNGILQNSAVPLPWWGAPTAGYLDIVHAQGAGLLDIAKAVQATTRIEPAKLSLGESAQGPVTRTLTIYNSGSKQVTYNLSSTSALATGPTNPPVATGANHASLAWTFASNNVTFSTPSVTVAAGSSATVDVTIAPFNFPARSLYGGYVVLTPQDGGAVYRVPYAGMVGDYQSIIAMSPTPYGFPWLAKLTDGSYWSQPNGASYGMVNSDIPYFLLHLDHGVAMLQMEVFNANTGQYWKFADNEQYIGRNSSPTGFYGITWDGTTTPGTSGKKLFTVPNGQYTVKISVLKALGNRDNPADWETWTSPTITIARP